VLVFKHDAIGLMTSLHENLCAFLPNYLLEVKTYQTKTVEKLNTFYIQHVFSIHLTDFEQNI
jgi:hypothetical protein